MVVQLDIVALLLFQATHAALAESQRQSHAAQQDARAGLISLHQQVHEVRSDLSFAQQQYQAACATL